ncbi:hypothetical protein EDB84DRAFT_1438726 [Lactarius hengduanensis]|nr:hypothetical protein EDB84DRAFT_1438726 [Lactarius hengduanensis]
MQVGSTGWGGNIERGGYGDGRGEHREGGNGMGEGKGGWGDIGMGESLERNMGRGGYGDEEGGGEYGKGEYRDGGGEYGYGEWEDILEEECARGGEGGIIGIKNFIPPRDYRGFTRGNHAGFCRKKPVTTACHGFLPTRGRFLSHCDINFGAMGSKLVEAIAEPFLHQIAQKKVPLDRTVTPYKTHTKTRVISAGKPAVIPNSPQPIIFHHSLASPKSPPLPPLEWRVQD